MKGKEFKDQMEKSIDWLMKGNKWVLLEFGQTKKDQE